MLKPNLSIFIQIIPYAVYGAIARLIPLGSVVILGHIMSPEEFGRSVIFISCVAILSTIIGMGQFHLIVKDKVQLSPLEYSKLLSSCILFTLSMSLLLIMLAYFFLVTTNSHIDNSFLLLLTIISALFLYLYEFVIKVQMVSEDVTSYGFLTTLKSASCAILSVVFVVIAYTSNDISRNIGYSLGLFVVAGVSVFTLTKQYVYVKPDLLVIRRVFFYGFSVALQIIANWMKIGADKVILVATISASQLGIYSYLFILASSSMIIGAAINNSVTPKLLKLYQTNRISELAYMRLMLIGWSLIGYAIFFLLLWGLYLWVVPKTFSIDVSSILVMVLAFYFQMIYLLYFKFFLFTDQMSLLGKINVVCAICFCISLVWFSSLYSAKGAIYSLFSYSFINLLWVSIFVTREERKMINSMN